MSALEVRERSWEDTTREEQALIVQANFLVVSHLGLVDRFVVRLLHFLRRWGIEEKMVPAIRLALVEAISNAIEHGNQLQLSRMVTVTVTMGVDKIIFRIIDEGNGFIVPENNATELNQQFADRGRGILMMKSVMDEVYWSGNTLEMVKYRYPSAGETGRYGG